MNEREFNEHYKGILIATSNKKGQMKDAFSMNGVKMFKFYESTNFINFGNYKYVNIIQIPNDAIVLWFNGIFFTNKVMIKRKSVPIDQIIVKHNCNIDENRMNRNLMSIKIKKYNRKRKINVIEEKTNLSVYFILFIVLFSSMVRC